MTSRRHDDKATLNMNNCQNPRGIMELVGLDPLTNVPISLIHDKRLEHYIATAPTTQSGPSSTIVFQLPAGMRMGNDIVSGTILVGVRT